MNDHIAADEQTLIANLLANTKTIALVGASIKPERPSHMVMHYLLSQGYHVIPVNPAMAGQHILDQSCFASLSDIKEPIDMVDIFRASEHCLSIVEEAVAIKARSIWMQIDICHQQARAYAEQAGLIVVENKCTKIEHQRLAK